MDRVIGSTIPQLRQWLARRGLSTAGAKMQLVQAVLQATDERPADADDFPLVPWHVQRAQVEWIKVREQREAQLTRAASAQKATFLNGSIAHRVGKDIIESSDGVMML